MNIVGVYFTKTGVTEDVMMRLKDALGMQTYNLKENIEVRLNDAEKIVIGTPIYVGMIPKKVVHFINQNKTEILNKELSIYIIGGEQPKDYQALFNVSNIDPAILQHASHIIYCGGEFRYDKLNFVSRSLLKMVHKKKAKEAQNDTMPSLNNQAIEKLIEVLES